MLSWSVKALTLTLFNRGAGYSSLYAGLTELVDVPDLGSGVL